MTKLLSRLLGLAVTAFLCFAAFTLIWQLTLFVGLLAGLHEFLVSIQTMLSLDRLTMQPLIAVGGIAAWFVAKLIVSWRRANRTMGRMIAMGLLLSFSCARAVIWNRIRPSCYRVGVSDWEEFRPNESLSCPTGWREEPEEIKWFIARLHSNGFNALYPPFNFDTYDRFGNVLVWGDPTFGCGVFWDHPGKSPKTKAILIPADKVLDGCEKERSRRERDLKRAADQIAAKERRDAEKRAADLQLHDDLAAKIEAVEKQLKDEQTNAQILEADKLRQQAQAEELARILQEQQQKNQILTRSRVATPAPSQPRNVLAARPATAPPRVTCFYTINAGRVCR